MNDRSNSRKEQIWKSHILQAKQFEGGLAAYCRNQNISIHNLSYWRKRFNKSSAVMKDASPFIPVKIESPVFSRATKRSLPDPKWLAEFILHLQGGVQ